LTIASLRIDFELRPVRCDVAAELSPLLGRLLGSVGQALKGRQKRKFVLPITSWSGCIGYIQNRRERPQNRENAMNTLSLGLKVHSRQGFCWGDVKRRLIIWWQYSRSRSELEGLSDTCLQDIGISRCSAEFEAAKPFWMP